MNDEALDTCVGRLRNDMIGFTSELVAIASENPPGNAYPECVRAITSRLACEYDRHIEGLFARSDWIRLLNSVGFEARSVPFEHSELEPGSHDVFVAKRPRTRRKPQ